MGLIANGPNLRHNPNLAHPKTKYEQIRGLLAALAGTDSLQLQMPWAKKDQQPFFWLVDFKGGNPRS